METKRGECCCRRLPRSDSSINDGRHGGNAHVCTALLTVQPIGRARCLALRTRSRGGVRDSSCGDRGWPSASSRAVHLVSLWRGCAFWSGARTRMPRECNGSHPAGTSKPTAAVTARLMMRMRRKQRPDDADAPFARRSRRSSACATYVTLAAPSTGLAGLVPMRGAEVEPAPIR